ncbi:hypothetical protein [Stenotrophomonas geniculata]|jgi:Beta-propeller domains of methanol dehydrogenase type|uniref:Uncharacterized protein n=1 Tax=Stenotrophomonas geniculata TaxID=86188 RepID=A0ABW1N1M0_9GAMM|nr:hypothetical protein [Stenotrophomonas geniculata]MCI1066840.1 hypothetical protein [Stenotrophomonas maltophilia]MCI1107960.1 hypothetical protein [Stenotrophomonas maltophilia]MCU1017645.1 hypothetical protein [Stenotrophomonas maltophilia]
MSAAVQSSPRHRRVVAIIATLSLLLIFSYLHAFERGPLYCNSGCPIQAPVIDAKTKDFLEKEMAPIDGWVPMWMFLTGTTYMVCNSTHCATYRQTFSGEYITDERIPITSSVGREGGGVGSGSGHGSGQGVGRGGGADVGGGSYGGGGRTGVVTVGPGGPVPKLPKGRQED